MRFFPESAACSTDFPLLRRGHGRRQRPTYLPDDSSSIPPMGHDRFIRHPERTTTARAAAQKRAQA